MGYNVKPIEGKTSVAGEMGHGWNERTRYTLHFKLQKLASLADDEVLVTDEVMVRI